MHLDNLFGGKAKKSRKQNNYSLPGIIGLTTSRKTAGSSRRFSPIVDRVVFPSMIPKYPKFKERKNMPNQEFLKKTQGCWHYRFRDSDSDGVVNGLDCFPFDKKRHDKIYSVRPFKEKFAKKIIPTDLDKDYIYNEKTGELTQGRYRSMSGRGTGWFGSGVYGFATKEQAEQYLKSGGGGHPGYIREFEVEKPFKPGSKSRKLHDASKLLYHARNEKDLELAEMNLRESGINTNVEELKKTKRYAYRIGEQPINYLLRKKGYSGVIPSEEFQNTSYGSVMHVAKPEEISLDVNKEFSAEERKRKKEFEMKQFISAKRQHEIKQEKLLKAIEDEHHFGSGEHLVNISSKHEETLPFKVAEENKDEYGLFRDSHPDEEKEFLERVYGEESVNYAKNINATLSKIPKRDISPAPVEKQQEWKEMPQDVKVAEQTIKTDTDGDSVPDEYDCNPENPKKQDSQLYLAKKNIKIGNLNIGEKKSKELTKDAIMFTIPQIYPNRTFIASGFKDVDFNRKENIDALSNVITHEELHHTLQHISPEASFELDNISVGSTEYKGMIMNPKTIATINPTIQKAIEKIHIHYPEKERNAKMIKIVDKNHEELKEYWSKKDQHIPPAPVEKQQEWKEMPQDVKVAEQTIKTDTDHDNVPDEYDKQTKTEDEYDKHEKMKKEFYEDQDRVYGVK